MGFFFISRMAEGEGQLFSWQQTMLRIKDPMKSVNVSL